MNADGNLVNWWTNSSEAQFEQKAQCLIDQYNAYVIGDTHVSEMSSLLYCSDCAPLFNVRCHFS